MRWLAYGLAALAVLLMASTPILWVAGIWVRGDVGDRLMGTGVVALVTGLAVGCIAREAGL